VCAKTDSDRFVAGDAGIPERVGGDERIVVGGDDERRHADPIDHAHGARAVVVVFGVPESEVGRSIHLVEIAHCPDLCKLRQIEVAGPAFLFPAHPTLQVAYEVPLIQDVGPPLQRVHTSANLQDGGDGRHA
jgi:hypothetical protein